MFICNLKFTFDQQFIFFDVFIRRRRCRIIQSFCVICSSSNSIGLFHYISVETQCESPIRKNERTKMMGKKITKNAYDRCCIVYAVDIQQTAIKIQLVKCVCPFSCVLTYIQCSVVQLMSYGAYTHTFGLDSWLLPLLK